MLSLVSFHVFSSSLTFSFSLLIPSLALLNSSSIATLFSLSLSKFCFRTSAYFLHSSSSKHNRSLCERTYIYTTCTAVHSLIKFLVTTLTNFNIFDKSIESSSASVSDNLSVYRIITVVKTFSNN